MSDVASRVIGAASQGAVGAMVGALLSAVTEPIVNRVLVKRSESTALNTYSILLQSLRSVFLLLNTLFSLVFLFSFQRLTGPTVELEATEFFTQHPAEAGHRRSRHEPGVQVLRDHAAD